MNAGWIGPLAAALMLAGGAAAEPYRLQRGDALRVAVAGVADLDERAVVDVDGLVRVPLGGAVPAAGRTVEEVATDLRTAIAGQPLQTAGDGGQVVTLQVPPDAVSVALDAYRPVYVGGDVRSPGAFDYVPGLTARRALALAGGLGRLGGDPDLLAAEVEGELGVIEARLEAARARAGRLRAIVEAPADPVGEGAAPDGSGSFDAVEAERLRLARRDAGADLEQIEAEQDAARARRAALERQLAVEEEGARADEADFERLRTLREDGRVTVDRLSDARRDVLSSSTRQLAVAAELARARREVQGLDHRAATLDEDVAAQALAALSDELAATEELAARRRGLEGRLALAGRAGAAVEALFDVQLRVARGEEALAVPPGGDLDLMPGDLLTVVLRRRDRTAGGDGAPARAGDAPGGAIDPAAGAATDLAPATGTAGGATQGGGAAAAPDAVGATD